MTSPRGQAWNPPRDFVAESFVLRTKACPEGRLFVNQYKRVKQQPDKPTVFKQRDISENQALTENRDHHRDVHWISDITIQSGNNQMASREYRRRRAHALQRESDEGIQKATYPQRDQHAPNKTEQ